MQVVNLCNTGLTGQLPVLWGVNASFPRLQSLDISRNLLSGERPGAGTGCAGWGM